MNGIILDVERYLIWRRKEDDDKGYDHLVVPTYERAQYSESEMKEGI
jgi:hypothetical protein